MNMMLRLSSLIVASPIVATKCAYPSVCSQPPAAFTRLQPERPRVQWNYNGGFCGAFSLQTTMMMHGAWVSEDLVRKANIGAACFGHGNGPNSTICMKRNDSQCISTAPEGCEVGPENYASTCKGLRLDCDVWDYTTQPIPQASAYKRWLKAHLARGTPIVWVPMLKGASNTPYGPRSCPGGGHFNHHEPILGIGSNRSLIDDAKVYPDDWIVHLSDENERELVTYYRTFDSLEDTLAMDGNCRHSDPTRSCAYPCFDEKVTYGIAVRGFQRASGGASVTLPVSLDVSLDEEPDPRQGKKPVRMHANVAVHGLRTGQRGTLYRYRGVNSFPDAGIGGYESRHAFTATGSVWRHRDPAPFLSDDAVYYIAVEEQQEATDRIHNETTPPGTNHNDNQQCVRYSCSTDLDCSDHQLGCKCDTLGSNPTFRCCARPPCL